MGTAMKTKTTSRRISSLVIAPAVLAFATWGSALWWLHSSAPMDDRPDQIVRVDIPPGMPAGEIGDALARAGVIRSGLAFRLWLQWQAIAARNNAPLQSGTYDLSSRLTLAEVVAQLQAGQPADISITIPEGWSIAQIAAHLEAKGFFPAADFIAATRSPALLRSKPWLPANLSSLEGFLFPDTYRFPRQGATPDEIAARMLSRFEEVAIPLWQEHQEKAQKQQKTAGFALKSLTDWVALASIVEREAVLASERATIAGVFWQRLQKGMRLESDPTVEYALGIQQTPEQPLTLAQVQMESPYNTYLHPGLPPGAIASPGLESLKAALAPAPTEYLYFVSRYDGSHVFSRTLEEHEAAAAQIRAKIDGQAGNKPPS